MAQACLALSERLYHDYCLDEPDFCDMTIVTVNATFLTHRAAVCSLSPIIKQHIADKGEKPKVFTLPSYDTYAVGAFLKFCYNRSYHLNNPVDESNTSPAIAHLQIYRLACELDVPSLQSFALLRFKAFLGDSIRKTDDIAKIASIIYNKIPKDLQGPVKERLLDQLKTEGEAFVQSAAFRQAVRSSCADLAVDLCQHIMRKPAATPDKVIPRANGEDKTPGDKLSGINGKCPASSGPTTPATKPEAPKTTSTPARGQYHTNWLPFPSKRSVPSLPDPYADANKRKRHRPPTAEGSNASASQRHLPRADTDAQHRRRILPILPEANRRGSLYSVLCGSPAERSGR